MRTASAAVVRDAVEGGQKKLTKQGRCGPAAGKVLLWVRRAGIWGTDLQLCRCYYPFIGILGD